MERTSNKKFQLVVTGYDYANAEYPSQVTMITEEELDILRPLFIAISKNTDTYNWSSSTILHENENRGGWVSYLVALYDIYKEFRGNNKFEKLVRKVFPYNGQIDSINRIEVNELKHIESFTF